MSSPLFACLRTRDRSCAVFTIARDFSPRIQRYRDGCVVLDVSGLGRLLGDPQSIATELTRAAADSGADVRVAVAPTQTAALLFTLADPALTVVTGDVAAPLAGLPLTSLQLLAADLFEGAGLSSTARRTQTDACIRAFDVLARWGLTTLGELAALPAADLSARLGQRGIVLQRLACGMDLRPLVPDRDVPRFIERIELEWPIDALEPLSFVLARLLDPLSAALERADRGAAAIRLELRLVDRTTFVRTLQLPAAMREARVLRTLLLLDLESHSPAAAIDVVTIEIDPAPARMIRYSLLERAVPSVETVATLTARLAALVGDSRCGSPALVDTHRPDGFEMRRFDLTHGVRGTEHHFSALAEPHPRLDSLRSRLRAKRSGEASTKLEERSRALAAAAGAAPLSTLAGPHPRSQRLDSLRSLAAAAGAAPLSMLAGPHPRSQRLDSLRSLAAAAGAAPSTEHRAPSTEHRAPSTQHPAPSTFLLPALRRFRPPVAVRVTLQGGRPVRVAIDRRGMPGGQVTQSAGPWRTSGAWWDPASTQWNRDEWDVALNDGSLCCLFRDRQSGVWFVEGVLD